MVRVALALVLAAGPAAPPPKESAEGRLRRTWGEPVDPAKDCTIAMTGDGKPPVHLPGTPHKFTPYPNAPSTAPRVRREVEGDFDARVTVVSVTLPGEKATGTIMTSAGLYV